MRMKCMKKLQSLFLSMMLIVAMALCMTGCNGKGSATQEDAAQQGAVTQAESKVLGEGEKQFEFTVVDEEGNATEFEVHTDKETVGEALLDVKLIEGEEGAYGLYVKTVNGITADYDADGTYWAFYVNDAYATSGVDTTAIVEGEVYSFKVEK